MTDLTPEYLAGVADEAAGLPITHEQCEQRVGTYTDPQQVADYFQGRRDRLACPLLA